MIHVYCGDGKGKTTAAFGQALRAVGSGLRVVIVQFMKNGETGEAKLIQELSQVVFLRGKEGSGFSFTMTEEEKARTYEIHMENLNRAISLVREGKCDLLVLDEAASAYRLGLLDQRVLRALVEQIPEAVELIITGREPADWMIHEADYVTEMKKIKHPFDRGIPARRGIER